MKNIIFLLLYFVSVSIFADSSGWAVKSIDVQTKNYPIYPKPVPVASTIHFENGKLLKTNIIDIKVIDTLISQEGVPFLIFSGVDCYDCDANTALYVYSPLAGFLDGSGGKDRYSYPGKLYYYIDNSLISDDRAFYGRCLGDDKINVVWYMKSKDDHNVWQQSLYIVSFKGKQRVGERIPVTQKLLDTIDNNMAQGICKEIPGDEMTSEP